MSPNSLKKELSATHLKNISFGIDEKTMDFNRYLKDVTDPGIETFK